jgi:hypothetical protein
LQATKLFSVTVRADQALRLDEEVAAAEWACVSELKAELDDQPAAAVGWCAAELAVRTIEPTVASQKQRHAREVNLVRRRNERDLYFPLPIPHSNGCLCLRALCCCCGCQALARLAVKLLLDRFPPQVPSPESARTAAARLDTRPDDPRHDALRPKRQDPVPNRSPDRSDDHVGARIL